MEEIYWYMYKRFIVSCYIMLFNHKVYNERQQVLHRTQLLTTSYKLNTLV